MEFSQWREKYRNDRRERSKGSADDDDGRDGLLAHMDTEHVRVAVGSSLVPEWVDMVEGVQAKMQLIKDQTNALRKVHGLRLKVTFDDDYGDQEHQIDVLVQTITALLRKCEQMLKRIAVVDQASLDSREARSVRLNVMRHLATQLQALSKQFRHEQKDFLRRLRGQREVGSSYFDNDENAVEMVDDEAMEGDVSTMALDQSERHAEIVKIAQSINELSTLFRELSVLVIEQGTVLDRIDYNIEHTLIKVQTGTKELVIADQYSKKAKSIKCILVLIGVIFVLLAILIFKHTGGGTEATEVVRPQPSP